MTAIESLPAPMLTPTVRRPVAAAAAVVVPATYRNLRALLIAAVIVRVLGMVCVPLLPEEAYYWLYSQHPALSYFDHPPMVAWAVRLGTWCFGDTEFGVRIIGNLMMIAASFVMFQLGGLWFDRTIAWACALGLQGLPAYFAAGFVATPDAPLLLFWLLCMLGLSIALKRGQPVGWYIAGVGLGAAMLSKYTGIFLGLGGLLAVIGCRPWRQHLRTMHPYLATAIALAVFSPVMVWNQRHGWASFRFQLFDRFAPSGLSLKCVAGFLASQLVVATPIVLLGIGWLFTRWIRRRRTLLSPRSWFAFCLSAPLLGLMAFESLRHSININWTLPAYLSLMPASASLFRGAWRRARMHTTRSFASPVGYLAASAVICLCGTIAVMGYLLAVQPRLSSPPDVGFGPWTSIATVIEDQLGEVRGRRDAPPLPLVIAGGKYRLASVLAFYCPSLNPNRTSRSTDITSQWFVSGEGLNFEYWNDPEQWIGRDCIVIDDTGELNRRLKHRFSLVEFVQDPRLPLGGEFQLSICHDYRGLKPLAPQTAPQAATQSEASSPPTSQDATR